MLLPYVWDSQSKISEFEASQPWMASHNCSYCNGSLMSSREYLHLLLSEPGALPSRGCFKMNPLLASGNSIHQLIRILFCGSNPHGRFIFLSPPCPQMEAGMFLSNLSAWQSYFSLLLHRDVFDVLVLWEVSC